MEGDCGREEDEHDGKDDELEQVRAALAGTMKPAARLTDLDGPLDNLALEV
jgi:hypothetical protein